MKKPLNLFFLTGCILPYISHDIGMCRPKGYGFWVILVYTGIDFAHFGLESGIAFEGPTVMYEHICQLVPIE